MARRMQTVAPPSAPTAAPSLGLPGQGRIFQSIQSDVTVPLLASAITGAGIASLVILISACIAYTQRVPFIDLAIPLLIGWIGIALVIMLAAWFWERHQIKKTWWQRELRDGVDYDGDHHVGPPNVTAIQVRGGDDPATNISEEQLIQLRFEEFVARLYNAKKRTTPVIRRLGFTERERADFIRELRIAKLIRPERGGNSAAWTWTYDDPQKTIALARKRIMWRVDSSSSSSSSPAK
jgi:hypothetical protein